MSDVEANVADLVRVTPRQLAVKLEKCFLAGNVPMVHGSPGIGKSSIFKKVAKRLRLKLIDHRLSTSPPEDLAGLPEFYTDEDGVRRARFVPFDIFPLKNTKIPDGYDGWLVFFDEINSASKATQAAAYRPILDHEIGQHPMHDNVLVGAAGNLATDRAIVNALSTAMQSRLCHFILKEDFDEWLMDVAIPNNYDSRIIAYLSRYPTRLMDFKPDHNNHTFCCPRTWEFMNNYVRNEPAGEISQDEISTYSGVITPGIASDFVNFTRVFDNLVDYKDVERDPEGAPVPNETGAKWATITHLYEKITEKNFDAFSRYSDRFDLSFRILFFRTAFARHPDLHEHPAFARSMIALARYLNPNGT